MIFMLRSSHLLRPFKIFSSQHLLMHKPNRGRDVLASRGILAMARKTFRGTPRLGPTLPI